MPPPDRYRLSSFLSSRGTRLEAALASAHGDLRAEILRQTASFAFRRGDYPLALARMQESADIKRAAGDTRDLGGRLNMLGLYRICAGEPGGRDILEQALDTLTAQGNELRAAESNLFLGIAALADDDLATAERRFGAAADVYGAAGDQGRLTACRGCLCMLRLKTGDLAGAMEIWAWNSWSTCSAGTRSGPADPAICRCRGAPGSRTTFVTLLIGLSPRPG